LGQTIKISLIKNVYDMNYKNVTGVFKSLSGKKPNVYDMNYKNVTGLLSEINFLLLSEFEHL
jgi:hypothetical protein